MDTGKRIREGMKKAQEEKRKQNPTYEDRLIDLKTTCRKIGFSENEDIANCSLKIWQT